METYGTAESRALKQGGTLFKSLVRRYGEVRTRGARRRSFDCASRDETARDSAKDDNFNPFFNPLLRLKLSCYTLADDFGVGGGQGDGVVAGFEGNGQVPDESAAGAVGGGEDVVGAGRNVGGDGGASVVVGRGLPHGIGV